MTALEKFNALGDTRETFLTALGLFRELESQYAARMGAFTPNAESRNANAPSDDKKSRLRSRIARDIWEPTTRRELVDRLTNLVVNKIATARDLQRAVVDAKKRRDVYERTGGRDGVETIWKALGYWAKCRYEEAGFEWTATSSILEPCPYKSVTAPKDEEQPKEEEKLTYEETKAALDEARRNLLKRSR